MTETGSQPPIRSHQTRSIAADTREWRVTDGAEEAEHERCRGSQYHSTCAPSADTVNHPVTVLTVRRRHTNPANAKT